MSRQAGAHTQGSRQARPSRTGSAAGCTSAVSALPYLTCLAFTSTRKAGLRQGYWKMQAGRLGCTPTSLHAHTHSHTPLTPPSYTTVSIYICSPSSPHLPVPPPVLLNGLHVWVHLLQLCLQDGGLVVELIGRSACQLRGLRDPVRCTCRGRVLGF